MILSESGVELVELCENLILFNLIKWKAFTQIVHLLN